MVTVTVGAQFRYSITACEREGPSHWQVARSCLEHLGVKLIGPKTIQVVLYVDHGHGHGLCMDGHSTLTFDNFLVSLEGCIHWCFL